MQQLHLVGFTTDLEGLIFSARKGAKSGGYLVVLDDRLRATVEDALRLRNGQAPVDGDDDGSPRPRRPRPESTLSPREIQSRLRSGSTIAEVAREAGVDEEWVSRFAVPIQAEQAQVVARARRFTFVKSRLGESALPLGTAVRWNLADKGVLFFDDDYEAAWSAYNLQGTSWVVRFEYTSRQKRQLAEWEVDLREGELLARNRTASDLGYIDAARRRRRPPALEPSPRETPARPVEQPRPVVARREEEPPPPDTSASAGPAAAARPAPRRGREPAAPASARGGGKARASVAKGRTSGKASKAAKTAKTAKASKASKASKTAKAAKAAKAGKATTSRKAASTKRARTQKAAGKKRGRGDHTAPKAAPATAAPVASPAPVPDEPARPSHLARPPSPMQAARRATTLPLHTPRPVPPRPVRPPEPPRRPAPPPEPDVDLDLAPEPVVAEERAPARREPSPRVVTEGVRVLGRPEKANGHGPAQAMPRRRPARDAEGPAASPAADSPERKLARRLAASQAGAGRTRRPPATPPDAEHLWHAGEPAPTVRIRADLAAGTRRAAEAADTSTAPPAPDAPPARTRRRERPLRAR